MNCSEPISMSSAEAYCIKCGHKKGYNGNKPLSMPHICENCGGMMVNKTTEKFYKMLDADVININKEIQKLKEKEQFEKKARKHTIKHSHI